MKKVLIFVFLYLVLSASPSHAVYFIEVTRSDDYLMYVDIDSIESRRDYGEEYLVVWEKWIPRGEKLKELNKLYKASVEYVMYFVAYNLERKQYKTLASIVYGSKGKPISSTSAPFSQEHYREIIPGTVGETTYNSVMYCYQLLSGYDSDSNRSDNLGIAASHGAGTWENVSSYDSISNYLGIVISREKTKEGGFELLEVLPRGLARSAGIQEGDILTKIDTYELKEHGIERVAAYIDLRIKQKAIIKVTILRGNQSKIIEMQL